MSTVPITISVITASPLTPKQRQLVEDLVTQKLGKTVSIQEQVDPNALGGVTLKIGDQYFDASVKGKLEKVQPLIPELSITTASALSPADEKLLRQKVAHQFGKDVPVQLLIDPQIIGGLRVRYGSKEYDSTLRTKLDKLQQHLKTQLRS